MYAPVVPSKCRVDLLVASQRILDKKTPSKPTRTKTICQKLTRKILRIFVRKPTVVEFGAILISNWTPRVARLQDRQVQMLMDDLDLPPDRANLFEPRKGGGMVMDVGMLGRS